MRGSDALHALARVLHHRTEGNPLFVVNMVDEVLAQGCIESTMVAVSAPATIRQLIERQFAQLSLTDQQLLATATVAGVEFSAAAMAAGMGIPVEEVEAGCAASYCSESESERRGRAGEEEVPHSLTLPFESLGR